MLTNAGADDRIDPRLRSELELRLAQDGQQQEIAAEGKRNAQLRRRKTTVLLPGGDSPFEVDGRSYDDSAPAFVLDEPEYDETIPSLMPYVVRWVHKPWWIFRKAGARFGMFPVLGPKAWSALIDHGVYCLRCLVRHADANPDECLGCGLTEVHRMRQLEILETVRLMHEDARPNRAQRRAVKRQRSSGLVLPSGVGL